MEIQTVRYLGSICEVTLINIQIIYARCPFPVNLKCNLILFRNIICKIDLFDKLFKKLSILFFIFSCLKYRDIIQSGNNKCYSQQYKLGPRAKF